MAPPLSDPGALALGAAQAIFGDEWLYTPPGWPGATPLAFRGIFDRHGSTVRLDTGGDAPPVALREIRLAARQADFPFGEPRQGGRVSHPIEGTHEIVEPPMPDGGGGVRLVLSRRGAAPTGAA